MTRIDVDVSVGSLANEREFLEGQNLSQVFAEVRQGESRSENEAIKPQIGSRAVRTKLSGAAWHL